MSYSDEEIIFDCNNKEKAFEVLALLCKTTGYFCYNPSDFSEIVLSLTWAETIQYISEDCVNDVRCALNTLQSFIESLGIALSRKYIIRIDINRIKDVLKKLEPSLYDKAQHIQDIIGEKIEV